MPNSTPFLSRTALYGVVNMGFILYIAIAALVGGDASPQLEYLTLLFAICSSSLLFARKLNDRYSIYAIFLVVYFTSYGLLDVLALTSKASSTNSVGMLTPSEILIILGGIAFVFGYHTSVRSETRGVSDFAAEDWPKTIMVAIGVLLWAAGTLATWYWNIHLTVRSGVFHNDTGKLVTTILMLGRYVQPLGLLIVVYSNTILRSKALMLITIAVVCFQVVLGFVSDTKGGAMLGGILVIVTSVLVRGKIPKAWVFAGILFIFVAFPIFQSYRAIVADERGMSNAESAHDIGKALRLSIENESLVRNDFGGSLEYHAQSFFERCSVKSAVEMIVSKTGKEAPFQHGYTLIPLLTSFIPRLIWPEKLDVQTGRLVNVEFQVTGNSVTYISPSYLGELYWNFGWIGAIVGMALLGLLLGWVNRLCDMSQATSVTRLLILAITAYQLCIRFEGTIATEFAVWIRSVVGILVMHWLFARSTGLQAGSSEFAGPVSRDRSLKFPNLLN